MIPVFYINLAARADRRAFMEEQFSRLGIEAARIEAVTAAELSSAQRDRHCNPARRWSMTEGRYACNLSHKRAWEALIASGSRFGLILEDDAVLSSSLPRFVAGFAEHETAAGVVRIEVFHVEPFHYRPIDTWITPDIGLRECLSSNVGSAGYIISAAAAKWLIEEPTFHTDLIDSFLFEPFSSVGRRLKARYADPALCVQIENLSDCSTGASNLNSAEDASHKRARKAHPVVKFSRHAEVWVMRDIPRWMMATFARSRGTNAVHQISFKAD